VFLPNTSITDRMSQHVKHAWSSISTFGYALLAPGSRPETVLSKVGPLLDRVYPAEVVGDRRKTSQRWTLYLTPFTDVHLTSGRWGYNEKPSGSWTTLYGVGIVGLLILFVACFNFMNLATAQASLRAREIALRKTHGAARRQLIVQFLGEAVLTALLSLVIALALVEILQPAFSRPLQHPIALSYNLPWLSLLVLIAVLAGLPLRFIDPYFNETRRRDVTMFVTHVVRFAQTRGKRFVVIRQLREHIQRLDVFGIIIQYALGSRDLAD
jgi:putative ABC transport system permease protein